MRGVKAMAMLALGLASMLAAACSTGVEAASVDSTESMVAPHGASAGRSAAKYLPQPALRTLGVSAQDLNSDHNIDIITVVDESGFPVASADVAAVIRQGRQLTNAAGEVTFEVPAFAQALRIEATPQLLQGNVDLYVAGHLLNNTVRNGRSRLITSNIIGDLENPLSLTLMALNRAGQPISGVAVDIAIQARGGMTDAGGSLAVNIPTGRGQVIIEARTVSAMGTWDSAAQPADQELTSRSSGPAADDRVGRADTSKKADEEAKKQAKEEQKAREEALKEEQKAREEALKEEKKAQEKALKEAEKAQKEAEKAKEKEEKRIKKEKQESRKRNERDGEDGFLIIDGPNGSISINIRQLR